VASINTNQRSKRSVRRRLGATAAEAKGPHRR
jgi:hypothetical protein